MTLDDALNEKLEGFARRIEASNAALAEKLARLTEELSSAPPSPSVASGDDRQSERLLSLPAAAKHLGVGESTLRAAVKAGKVRFTCPGGTRYKFRVSDLDAYARARPTERRGRLNDYEDQSRKNIKKALRGE